MSIVFRTSQELKLSLNPVCLEERVPSVAFDLLVEVCMQFQRATIESKGFWFTYKALNEFEEALSRLRSAENGLAALIDMSERPLLQISRKGTEVKTEVCVMDRMHSFLTRVEIPGSVADIELLYNQLNSYAKWW